ncbi:putative two-component system sensor kinase [Actinoplanes missouriensis 431]|uniref:histidine kinase n=1 Tax=Actinoplanes missouriensis (strain ATCC 14538 / DSM 43046 / CBS 188.64 / JCM 3121 / NBRC 102363 / NCIMB 12654 / NRRL B-3342 / UNCC 431) TaxID=512565 RepID=I0H5H5_ACTM4|nr:histidine kinase [Actinoplanes missouriensis]BAL88262.1 putative two-component system sensor kinase [Actinoplanes missouriensis 431]
MTGTGRYAWRVWAPPILTVMIMMAAVAYQRGHLLRSPTDGQLILILLGATALLFRLRSPAAVTAVTVLTGTALPLAGGHLVLMDVAAVVALYTLATLRDRRTAWTAGVLAAVSLTAAAIPWQAGGLFDLANLVPANYALIAVALGVAAKDRQALLAQIRERAEQDARRRVHEERVRIARDLHDVVAHHITLVNAQAGVAHHLMEAHPDRAREALAGIRDTSRTALDELRATVGLLRADDDPPDSLRPAPAFADVDALIEGFRQAGQDITVSRTGTPRPLTGAGDLAAYRIVQEALTNAGKHGTGRRVEVALDQRETDLRITVVNPAQAGHRGEGTGHGLIGMRERAEAAGGTLTCGMRADGAFEVVATLPVARG